MSNELITNQKGSSMKEIYTALIKFQGEVKPVFKDSQNPFLKNYYADLSAIILSVTPTLVSNDLGFIQTLRVDNGHQILQTKIVHSSGQEVISEMLLLLNADPQKTGSLLSYYKRYMLQAALGIPTTDDDDASSAAPTGGPSASKEVVKEIRSLLVKIGKTEKDLLIAIKADQKSLDDLSTIMAGKALSLVNSKIKENV